MTAKSWTIGARGSILAPVVDTQLVQGEDLEWASTDIEGFKIKVLYQDSGLGEKTMLMKVDAGASAPLHSHPDEFEQVYVINGSFSDQFGVMKTGDYCCRAPGAPHSSASDEGALVLLVYTRRDPLFQN